MLVTGAEAIVQCLLEQGVDTVFGYPGGMVLPLYDALYDENKIHHVLTAHEQGAAHAADGYARASGEVGICIATSGPGATNLVTGLATAFMDSIPVVAITGQVPTSLLGRDAFQEVDIIGVTMPVTKHNFQVKDINKLMQMIRLAFKVASSGRPGPVLVDIPRDIFYQEVNFDPIPTAIMPEWKRKDDIEDLMMQVTEVLNQAKKPLIVAGGGVISAGASEELLAFAERHHFPVVTTLMGLGAFPSNHEQFLGMTGLHGLETANNAVYEADVIIAVGSRFSDRLTGNREKYIKGTNVIHIDIDPAEIDKNVMSSIGLAGDMKAILMMLTDMDIIENHNEWWKMIFQWREKYQFVYDDTYLNVPWVMRTLAEQTENLDTVFVTDVGQHQMWAAQHLRLNQPRSWISSGGLGTMGFGLPAAMGAQLAKKEKRIIHIAGDGGIKMTGSEYYTIAAQNLPIISIIINNSSLGMIRQLQHVFYQDRYASCLLEKEMDFAAYARSFGIESVAVNTNQEFCLAFKHALQNNTPQVIVVNVIKEYVSPMAKAGAAINQFVDL